MATARPWKAKLWLSQKRQLAVSHKDTRVAEEAYGPRRTHAFVRLWKQQSHPLIMPMFSSSLYSYFYSVSIVCPRNNINRCCFDYFCILMGQEIAIDFLNRSVNLYFISLNSKLLDRILI